MNYKRCEHKSLERLPPDLRKPVLLEYQPMLLTTIDMPFDTPHGLFELKYDGLRVLAQMDDRKARLLSRNGKLQNLQFPDIEEGLLEEVKESTVLDSEVVCQYG